MSGCNLDHSQTDVLQKLQSQALFLTPDLARQLENFIHGDRSQDELNTLFHLLKKYDLASQIEKQERNKQLLKLIA